MTKHKFHSPWGISKVRFKNSLILVLFKITQQYTFSAYYNYSLTLFRDLQIKNTQKAPEGAFCFGLHQTSNFPQNN